MGANCPSAVPCLLRGCIDASLVATDDVKAHTLIANTAKAGVRALANLSYRESIRARSVLEQSNAMVDVQLELAIKQDPTVAACLLNKHFSQYALLDRTMESKPVGDRQQRGSMQDPSDGLSEVSFKPNNTYQLSDSASDRRKTLSFQSFLEDNSVLLRKSFICILEALGDNSRSSISPKPLGRTIILLRALSYLILFGGTWKPVSAGDIFTPDLTESTCKELVTIQTETFRGARSVGKGVAPRSDSDDFYRYLTCACLATHARATFSSENESPQQASADKCLEYIFNDRSISLQSDVFASKLAKLLKAHDAARVCNFILEILAGKPGSFAYDKTMEDGFSDTYKMACSVPNLDFIIEKGITDAAATEDSSALLLCMQVKVCGERADQFIRSILHDPKALISNDLCDLLQSSVTAIKTDKGTAIPYVLPIQLQSLSLKIDWRKGDARISQPSLESQFLIQLLYCLYFLDDEPLSPFAIDPRDFPLKEILELATLLSEECMGFTKIESELKRLITKMAPEVSSQIDMVLVDGANTVPRTVSCTSIRAVRHTHCEELSNSIRECRREMSKDPSGCFAERNFVYASRLLTLSDLTLTASRALVGPTDMPVPFMTYAGICRDPLILLKAPLSVWRCRGLRRIALYTLSCLLRANDAIVAKASPTGEVASELFMSRDAIVVSCLIIASVGGGVGEDCVKPLADSTTIAVIREMVAKHVGLVAQLVKQGKNDAIVDW